VEQLHEKAPKNLEEGVRKLTSLVHAYNENEKLKSSTPPVNVFMNGADVSGFGNASGLRNGNPIPEQMLSFHLICGMIIR